MKRWKFAFCALLLTACASTTEVPDGEPTVDGAVISVSPASVHIRAAGDQCGIVFRVDDDTRILLQQPDDRVTPSSIDVIRPGARARAWTDGPIAESCPGQGHADVILLVTR